MLTRSTASVLAPALLTLPTLALLLALAFPGRSPLRVARVALAHLGKDRGLRLLVAGMAAVIGANFLLTAMDGRFTAVVGRDFAADLHRVEGDVVAGLQRSLGHPLLTALFSWIYVLVYPLLVVASLLVYAARGDGERLRALGAAYFANYVLIQPFYLFFPVTEPAYVAHSGVVNGIETILPGFMDGYRLTSGIDNCFPSLHTSLSLSVALVAFSSPYRAWRVLACAAAAATAASTVFLGIHWMADLIAGVVFGWACWWIGEALLGLRSATREARAEGHPARLLSRR
ncbi:MAG: phosphatase PAP2 family protein [Planctomycetota bacterium]